MFSIARALILSFIAGYLLCNWLSGSYQTCVENHLIETCDFILR